MKKQNKFRFFKAILGITFVISMYSIFLEDPIEEDIQPQKTNTEALDFTSINFDHPGQDEMRLPTEQQNAVIKIVEIDN